MRVGTLADAQMLTGPLERRRALLDRVAAVGIDHVFVADHVSFHTGFGMELFEMLNLQLLVLTPLQKINVIEKYISSVNFVHNNAEGSCSVLRNMTIEELNQERLDQGAMRIVS